MSRMLNAGTYCRSAGGSVAKRAVPVGYETKFAGLTALCKNAEKDGLEVVVVAAPWVLGDTHAEIVESLSRIADADLRLGIASR